MRFEVTHRTTYRYDAPVVLGEHRLMLRPRDSHDLRLMSATLALTPSADVRWRHDVFGNSVGVARFAGTTTTLDVISTLVLERFPAPESVVDNTDPASGAATSTIAYTADERWDLGALLLPENPAEEPAVRAWLDDALGKVRGSTTEAMSILRALNAAIHARIAYEPRYAEGTMTAGATLAAGTGTCRDFAFLMIEAARLLGYGARFVTGYISTPPPDGDGTGTVGGAATHAWAEIYVPGAGWLSFDPTNQLIESHDLIRVAAVRSPRQAMPISGTFTGVANATLEVVVDVVPLA